MACFKINSNFLKLPGTYLFTEVARRVQEFVTAHPDENVIKMGIGDVTRPLPPAVIKGLEKGVKDESEASTFHGYGPEQGYSFLAQKIAEYDFHRHGVEMGIDEIFISDGAKSDCGNIGDILSMDCKVALTDPVYPVYIDSNVMAGRAGDLLSDGRWSRIEYLPCTAENHFVPALPKQRPDMLYLCYPNNPTGTTLTRDQLKVWVDYCRENGVLLLFDAAYERFITEEDVPHTIYEIPGAKEVAIEFHSYSKTAGFTGIRLGYTIVPKELKGLADNGKMVSLNPLWRRRQTTKFNGASYITQCGAMEIYTPEGEKEIMQNINYYSQNAHILLDGAKNAGLEAFGGINSPYVWVKGPDKMGSWDFFDLLLNKLHIIGTPGSGFGPSGEGYLRLTGFSTKENTLQAAQRLMQL